MTWRRNLYREKVVRSIGAFALIYLTVSVLNSLLCIRISKNDEARLDAEISDILADNDDSEEEEEVISDLLAGI